MCWSAPWRFSSIWMLHHLNRTHMDVTNALKWCEHGSKFIAIRGIPVRYREVLSPVRLRFFWVLLRFLPTHLLVATLHYPIANGSIGWIGTWIVALRICWDQSFNLWISSQWAFMMHAKTLDADVTIVSLGKLISLAVQLEVASKTSF